MYRIEWSRRALADLDRLEAFLTEKNSRAAAAAIETIFEATRELRRFPAIGRPLADDAEDHRELLVPYSNSGYLILYLVGDGVVEVHAVKHQREAKYGASPSP